MKHLILSDIHGNLEALRAVLDDADPGSFDSIICLGDCVGYGASPNECVCTLRELPHMSAVLGNHDSAVVNRSERNYLNPVAVAGIEHSDRELDGDGRRFLESLPMVIDSDPNTIFVHASPFRPEKWVYVMDPMDAADAFQVMSHSVAFIGHTHFPAIYSDSGTVEKFAAGAKVPLGVNGKRIINVGSVGQPRDGDPRAAYVVFDDEERRAEMVRVSYDIDTAAKKILDAGLPPMLADRLRRGY